MLGEPPAPGIASPADLCSGNGIVCNHLSCSWAVSFLRASGPFKVSICTACNVEGTHSTQCDPSVLS